MISRRWIAHHGHDVPTWKTALRHEMIAAFRRGSMSAERCLKTYLNQGEPDILPFEAVVFLAVRVVIDRETHPCDLHHINAEILEDRGEMALADLFKADRETFLDLIEEGRAFFFPYVDAIGEWN
jgi:hypothetical protein